MASTCSPCDQTLWNTWKCPNWCGLWPQSAVHVTRNLTRLTTTHPRADKLWPQLQLTWVVGSRLPNQNQGGAGVVVGQQITAPKTLKYFGKDERCKMTMPRRRLCACAPSATWWPMTALDRVIWRPRHSCQEAKYRTEDVGSLSGVKAHLSFHDKWLLRLLFNPSYTVLHVAWLMQEGREIHIRRCVPYNK